MNRRTLKPKKKTSTKRSLFPIELTRRETLLWSGIAAFAMLWMFTLGVIVGRGHSPVRFDVENIKNELAALRKEALKVQPGTEKSDIDMTPDTMNFDFYEALTDKKEEARFKSVLKAQESPSEPLVGQDRLPKPEPKTPSKESGKNQQRKEPKQRQEPSSSGEEKKGAASFSVQVASLQDSTKANELVSSLTQKGYKAYSVTARVPGKGIYHRVRVGHFKNRREASRILARLKGGNAGLDPMIIRE